MGVFSIMGDILSTMGDSMSTMGVILSTMGAILSILGDVQHHEDIMIHVGRYMHMSALGDD